MPSDVIDRRVVREKLAEKLATKLGSDWTVYDHKTNAVFGKARNLVVASGGSGRAIGGAQAEEADTTFRFRLFVLIRYADSANGWTTENSEDELDLAEKKITDFLTDTQELEGFWNRTATEGVSDPDNVTDISGVSYRREIITVRTEIYT